MCQNMIDCPSLLHELITFSSLLTIYHIKIVAKLWHKRLLSYIFSTISCVFIYIYIYRERERERGYFEYFGFTKLGQNTHSFISPRISFSPHFIPMWAKPNVNMLLQ